MRFRSKLRKCTSRMRDILTMHGSDSTREYLRKRSRRKMKKEKHMIRTNVWMKLLTTGLLTAATAFPQSSERLPATDAQKIADALRAGPAFITKDATVLDWPSSPSGEFRVLRTG